MFVVFEPQVEADVVEWKIEEHQQEVLDNKCEQVVSGADKHRLSDGWDAHHDVVVCQDEIGGSQQV